jgi:hypothetical protein
LNKEDPAYLLRVDFNEYLDHLISETEWQPLEWHEEEKTVEPFTVQREQHDTFFDRTFVMEIPMLRIRIPLSPHPQRQYYFEVRPSTGRLSGEPDWQFETDRSSGTEYLILEVEESEDGVKRGLENVQFWLGNRNRDIEEGNARLPEIIRPVWEAKRKQLEERAGSTQTLLQKLDIPLYQDPKARTRPVEVKPRQLRTAIQRPTARTTAVEASLEREDVVKLVDFIEQYTREFEVAPKTYAKMDEEELRDLLVGMMNANYPGSTTAETFSKLGKTDISLHVDFGHVLICECKFWSGAKAYGKAIEQLFSYLKWRQNYGVLLHFCKLKDMSRALLEAQRATSEHPSFTPGSLHRQTETRFSSRHTHPQDAEKLVEIHHVFVDLSV